MRSVGLVALAICAIAAPSVAFGQDATDPAPLPAHAGQPAPPPLEQPTPAPAPRVEAPRAPRRLQDQPSLASRLRWRWPEFRPYQYGILAVQVVAAIASIAIPGDPRFEGDNGFDDAARDALRIDIPEGGRYARDASDVGLVLLINQRFIDNLLVTWWWHDKGSTAWQMTLIDAQTVSFSASINSLVAGAAGRERPYGNGYCRESPESESTDCTGNNRYRSFFSGHATAAFTLASLTCAHHIELPIYGGGAADVAPCIGNMAVAGAVSILRVSADQHFVTDVLTGAAFGTISGFAIPYVFHYAWDDPSETKKPGAASFTVLPAPTGVSVAGAF